MNRRLERLRQKLAENELDAIIVTKIANCRYISGFTGSNCLSIISRDSTVLVTDFRYYDQAIKQAPDFKIVLADGELMGNITDLISGIAINKLGFESKSLTHSTYQLLVETIISLDKSIDLVATENIVEYLRSVKDNNELTNIKKACIIVDAAFNDIITHIKPGVTEKKVAWEIEKYLRENGSDDMPFKIIVASGPNSALPHSIPTDRCIGYGEPVVIDYGARVAGYCSDITRTMYFGDGDDIFLKVYNTVLKAQIAAIDNISTGISGEQADRISRSIIENEGYGQYFGHGLGHGVGLEVHEEPRLGYGSYQHLDNGMVFTIEPGIYISGWGGVRIEDTVTIEDNELVVLTKAKKNVLGGNYD